MLLAKGIRTPARRAATAAASPAHSPGAARASLILAAAGAKERNGRGTSALATRPGLGLPSTLSSAAESCAVSEPEREEPGGASVSVPGAARELSSHAVPDLRPEYDAESTFHTPRSGLEGSFAATTPGQGPGRSASPGVGSAAADSPSAAAAGLALGPVAAEVHEAILMELRKSMRQVEDLKQRLQRHEEEAARLTKRAEVLEAARTSDRRAAARAASTATEALRKDLAAAAEREGKLKAELDRLRRDRPSGPARAAASPARGIRGGPGAPAASLKPSPSGSLSKQPLAMDSLTLQLGDLGLGDRSDAKKLIEYGDEGTHRNESQGGERTTPRLVGDESAVSSGLDASAVSMLEPTPRLRIESDDEEGPGILMRSALEEGSLPRDMELEVETPRLVALAGAGEGSAESEGGSAVYAAMIAGGGSPPLQYLSP